MKDVVERFVAACEVVVPWVGVVSFLAFVLILSRTGWRRRLWGKIRHACENERERVPAMLILVLVCVVFSWFYAFSEWVVGSRLEYGILCHFFDLGNQRIALSPAGAPGGGAVQESDGEFYLACVVALAGKILLAGIFVSWLVNWFGQGIAKVRQGLADPVGYRDHVVIIGYRKGVTENIIKRNEKDQKYIVQTEQDVARLRVRLFARLGKSVMQRIGLVSGRRTVGSDLEKLSLHRCKTIYLLGEDGEEAHDADSLACLELMLRGLGKRSLNPSATCYLFWERPEASSLFQKVGLMEYLGNLPDDSASLNKALQNVAARNGQEENQPPCTGAAPEAHPSPETCPGAQGREYRDLRAYNLHELWAEHVLIGRGWRPGGTTCPPLDREPITYASSKRVHFIVLGMSRLGMALARTTFHLAHFPNFLRDPSRKTLITLIDDDAETVMNRMRNHDPYFFQELDYAYLECGGQVLRYWHAGEKKLLDLEVRFIKGRVESREIQNYLEKSASVPTDLVTIAVCFGDASLALSTALDLPGCIRDRQITVYVRQESNSNILEGARSAADAYAHLFPIGMREMPLDDEALDLIDPKLFHMIYHMCRVRLSAKDPRVRKKLKKALCGFLPQQVRNRCPFRAKDGCLLSRECASNKLESIEAKDSSSWKQFAMENLGLDLESCTGEGVHTEADPLHPCGPWHVEEEWNRLSMVHHWSNRYFSNSVESKLRSLGWDGADESCLTEVMIGQLDTMSRMEHNRWLAERLLLGTSPSRHECLTLFDNLEKDKHLFDIALCLAICIVREHRAQKKQGCSSSEPSGRGGPGAS